MSEIVKVSDDLKRFMLNHYGSTRVAWTGNHDLEKLSGARHYKSFRKEGQIYSIGDFAYIISPKDPTNGLPIVGCIKELYQKENNKKCAKINYFYRIQDFSNPPTSDPHALFSSSLEGEVELDCVQKKCIVLPKEKFQARKASHYDTYYVEGPKKDTPQVTRGPWSKMRRAHKIKQESSQEVPIKSEIKSEITSQQIEVAVIPEIETSIENSEKTPTNEDEIDIVDNSQDSQPIIPITILPDIEEELSQEVPNNSITLPEPSHVLPNHSQAIPEIPQRENELTTVLENSKVKINKKEEEAGYIEILEDFDDNPMEISESPTEAVVEKEVAIVVAMETEKEKVTDSSRENKESDMTQSSEHNNSNSETPKESSENSQNSSQENKESQEENSKENSNKEKSSKEENSETPKENSSTTTQENNSGTTNSETPQVSSPKSKKRSASKESPKKKQKKNESPSQSPKKKQKKTEGSQSPKKKKDSSKKKRKKFDDDSEEEEKDSKQQANFKIGEYVWAKLKSFPWWPGRVSSPDNKDIEPSVLELRKKNTLLIYFFGSRDYSWVPTTRLLNFMDNFKEKTRSVDDFDLGEAIEEAIDCSPDKEKLEDMLTDEDTACEVCKLKTDADNMLLCDNCDCGYHLGCLVPKLFEIPDTNWYCPDCIKKGKSMPINTDSQPVMIIKPGVSGLFNIGSTCYINSALQCLNAVTDFRKRVSNKGNLDNALISALEVVLKALWTEKGVSKAELEALKSCSGNALDYKYHTSEHQDINEFLIQLLEYVHVQFDKKYKLENPNTNHESSPVVDNFEGTLARTRTCPNGHSYTSREPFRVLPLQFTTQQARNKKPIELKKMIDEFSKEESLECRCERCGGSEDRVFKQVTEIEKFPKFLIIQLVRFVSGVDNETWWSNKIKTEVKYPLYSLDLTSKGSLNKGEYNLLGVVSHKGEVRGGHYWAFVRDTDEDDQEDDLDYWYNFNDHNVKPLNEEEDVQSPEAYMLMYERKS